MNTIQLLYLYRVHIIFYHIFIIFLISYNRSYLTLSDLLRSPSFHQQ